MPKLWIMSDLHLETVRHPDAFWPQRPEFDVLVVAGDVWEGSSAEALRIVARLAAGKPCVFVLGNHEPWHRNLRMERSTARKAASRYGVTLLDDNEVFLAGVRFVGGTLWADGLLAGAEATPNRPTGESVWVGRGDAAHLINSADEAALHRRARRVIETALRVPCQLPTVVVTHHAPHPSCLLPAHRSGWGAGNAASDLSGLTDVGTIALWVHGHVHESGDQVRPGGTRIVCNPAGPRFSNFAFRDDWVVEV